MSKNKGGSKAFAALQNVGKTFMLPIALLPVAGLFLGVGASFTGESFIKMYHLEAILGQGTFLNRLLTIFNDCGSVIFNNLGLLFAVSVALGLAKSKKGVAALSALVGYFMMYATMTSAIVNFGELPKLKKIGGLLTDMLGFTNTMNTGVFGGIFIGLICVWLHNKYYRIKFPDAISFFGGTHFSPIAGALAGIFGGFFMAWFWPYIAMGIAGLGTLIGKSGYIGTFFYAYVYRALIPFGLHHVFYLPFWQTAVGGTAHIAGQTVVGAQNIVFAQLGAGTKISWEAARYFAFEFPVMIGGFPAAALAMYHCAKKSKRKDVKGLLLSSSLTSILTGITEPLEFTILFASPFLFWAIHCVLFAFSAVFVSLLKIGVGFTFSGGLLDMILYGILPGQARTNWIALVPLILFYFALYYFVFKFAITKFNLKTPGREDDEEESTLHTKADYVEEKKAQGSDNTNADGIPAMIVDGLGGKDNISTLEACATRLRVSVKDPEIVKKNLLKSTGAVGTVVHGNGVQVIYGTKVSTIGPEVEDYLGIEG
ncbi:PTS transporter subunit EIIC [Companilactobacillus pabuli]|uniref:PTS transporter subunit EIIC n=1 Tax=Companilactobacillus pabuli TaxID=2714036 RepID=A0A7L7KYU2_9LACO|nr:PTS transporter subunit EIIC [Companilactobacillus pabuli]QMT84925.1 PTS transporter subunit EIIC [Companilactobacillus pabuli]